MLLGALCHIVAHAAVELLRRIVAHLLLAAVHGRGLTDDREIPPRANRERVADHAHTENFRVLILHAEAVVVLGLIPVLKFNHEVHGLHIFHALCAEQRAHVDDADAAELDKVLGNRRCPSDQSDLRDFPELDHIVRNQTVAAPDEFQCRLTFSDTGISHNENTLAVDIHQDAVNRELGRKFCLEPANQLRSQIARGLRGHHAGDAVLAALL